MTKNLTARKLASAVELESSENVACKRQRKMKITYEFDHSDTEDCYIRNHFENASRFVSALEDISIIIRARYRNDEEDVSPVEEEVLKEIGAVLDRLPLDDFMLI